MLADDDVMHNASNAANYLPFLLSINLRPPSLSPLLSIHFPPFWLLFLFLLFFTSFIAAAASSSSSSLLRLRLLLAANPPDHSAARF
jgi:hypothetical protein